MKTALIFGVTGQDGYYLSEMLLYKDYKVVGVARRTSTPNNERILHLYHHPNFKVVEGDITDPLLVYRIITDNDPWKDRKKIGEPPYVDLAYEIYNLAAQSHVGTSFGEPFHTTDVTYRGCLNVLESIRTANLARYAKFYQASSSEMFGSSTSPLFQVFPDNVEPVKYYGSPNLWRSGERNPNERYMGQVQNEQTPMLPNSPYAIAKLAAHHACRVYRDSYGIFACSGILFNHESEVRGLEFVTRKIARYVAQYSHHYHNHIMGKEAMFNRFRENRPLKLGNLEVKRDWGHASDYVRGMWLMLQQEKPDDYVLATGETHSVNEFLCEAFNIVSIPEEHWRPLIQVDKSLLRPCEVPFLRGDFSKANRKLGWKPEVDFKELVSRMVLSEVDLCQKI